MLATIASFLWLPCPILGRYGNGFPLNAPAWSLSMEYFINVVYGLVLVRVNKKWILVLLKIALVCLGWVSMGR